LKCDNFTSDYIKWLLLQYIYKFKKDLLGQNNCGGFGVHHRRSKWVYKIVFLSFVYKIKRKSFNIIVVVAAAAVVVVATGNKIVMQFWWAVVVFVSWKDGNNCGNFYLNWIDEFAKKFHWKKSLFYVKLTSRIVYWHFKDYIYSVH
jgi:hypothetical protein